MEDELVEPDLVGTFGYDSLKAIHFENLPRLIAAAVFAICPAATSSQS